MYEDDGLTREHRQGIYATTKFEVSTSKNGAMKMVINAAKGDFRGRLKNRVYLVDVKTTTMPHEISFNNQKIKKMKSKSAFDASTTGWFFDSKTQNGILFIKTSSVSTDVNSSLEIEVKK